MAACHRPVETQFIASPEAVASPKLQAIDSLMWQRPDSALAVLLPWFDSLTSTLNDNPSPKRPIAGEDPLSPTRNDDLFFLAARAHYINGVGYYEADSLVEACTEYLTALKTMEGHFPEKALAGKKAKFMTYTYNRLGDMFSAQFMMDAAIHCYKNSICFSKVSPISAYSVSSALYRIGNQLDKKKEADSANYYYMAAISNIPDTLNLLYRDIVSSQSLLYYQQTHQAEPVLRRLKQITAQAEDFGEKLTRYLTIGDVYFEDRQFDSARHYLQLVFENQNAVVAQLQAAEFLRILNDSLGAKEESDNYMRFLAMQKPMEHDSEAKVSVLGELFKNYLEKRQKHQAEKDKLEEREHAIKRTLSILVRPSRLGFVCSEQA